MSDIKVGDRAEGTHSGMRGVVTVRLTRRHACRYIVGNVMVERMDYARARGRWVAFFRASGTGWMSQGGGSFRTPEDAVRAARAAAAKWRGK